MVGEPDRFLISHRERLVYIIGEVIRATMGRKPAFEYLENWTKENVASDDRETFREIAENELMMTLCEGNCARYRVGLREFQAWQEVWNKKTS